MPTKDHIVPFRLTFDGLFKVGKARAVAEANYLYTGYELALRLAEIEHDGLPTKDDAIIDVKYRYGFLTAWEAAKARAKLAGIQKNSIEWLDLKFEHFQIGAYDYEVAKAELTTTEGDERARVLLDVEHKHKKISDYDYETAKANLDLPEGKERDLALLEIAYRHGKIKENAYQKEKATLNDEPWIDIVDHGFDINQGLNGVHFEFDWNGLWIDFLRLNGYSGETEQDLVEKWFADVCREAVGRDQAVLDPSQPISLSLYRDRHRPGL
jgi:hypothetical protein